MLSTAVVALSVLVPSAYAASGAAFNPSYYADPWTGVCASGMMQTPIDLPADPGALPSVPENLVTEVMMPMVKAPVVKNVGSAMQVAWDPMSAFDMKDDTIFPMVSAGGDKISDVFLTKTPADLMLKMIPLQIHWHVASEHSIGGMLAPMEAHIVTAVGPGEAPKEWGCDAVWEGGDPVLEKCIAVFGVVYITAPDAVTPPAVTKMIEAFPETAGAESPYPDAQFDLEGILPEDKSYDTYIGSLTTPPCAEGLRWHVFTSYVPISIDTVMNFEAKMSNITDLETGERQLYRHNNRPVQPLNGRKIWHMDATPKDERVRRPRGPRGGL